MWAVAFSLYHNPGRTCDHHFQTMKQILGTGDSSRVAEITSSFRTFVFQDNMIRGTMGKKKDRKRLYLVLEVLNFITLSTTFPLISLRIISSLKTRWTSVAYSYHWKNLRVDWHFNAADHGLFRTQTCHVKLLGQVPSVLLLTKLPANALGRS